MKRLLFICLFPMLGYGVLAPLPQSIRELNAIINYPSLSDHLIAPSAIKEITKVADGYLIVTSSHVLKVTVEYSKESRIGPRKFILQFGPSMLILK